MHRALGKGENCVANGGRRSSVDCRAIAPAGRNDCHDRQVAMVRERHETTNRRFQTFGVLCQRFRRPLEKYGIVLKPIPSMVQLATSNGDDSFEVEHSECFLGSQEN